MADIYLNHMSLNANKIYNGKKIMTNILEDGYLRPSKNTKNYAFTNDDKNSQKYIYFEMNIYKTFALQTFTLDIGLLLETVFWINYGWRAGVTNESQRIDGRKLSREELITILQNYCKEIKELVKKQREKNFIYNKMTHEILVKTPVNLHKYLRIIGKEYLSKEEKKYVKENYPNVKIL